MKIEKKYCSDLNSILCKYLKQEQIHEYIESIAIDFLPQQPLRMTSDENQLNDYFNENIQTKKIRLLTDTLVTHTGKIMEEEKYIEFLLEFGKSDKLPFIHFLSFLFNSPARHGFADRSSMVSFMLS